MRIWRGTAAGRPWAGGRRCRLTGQRRAGRAGGRRWPAWRPKDEIPGGLETPPAWTQGTITAAPGGKPGVGCWEGGQVKLWGEAAAQPGVLGTNGGLRRRHAPCHWKAPALPFLALGVRFLGVQKPGMSHWWPQQPCRVAPWEGEPSSVGRATSPGSGSWSLVPLVCSAPAAICGASSSRGSTSQG